MEAVYFPAVHPSAVLIDGANPYGLPLHWCNKDFPDRFYPHVLWSYAYWSRSRLNMPSPEGLDVLGDSGGYAVITQGESFDPVNIARWQQRTCRRGMILDIPPYRPNNSVQFTGTASEYFKESLARTCDNVRNARSTATAHNCGNQAFRWWGVVQGESVAQMEEWHHNISSIYSFDKEGEGWALAPKPSYDLVMCARYMKFATDQKIKRVHVLQVTKPTTVAVILALAHLSGSIEYVSYDSATQSRAALNRTMLFDDELKFGHARVKEITGACSCVGCSSYMQITEQYGKPHDTQFWRYVMLHNFCTLRKQFETLHLEVQLDPEGMLRKAAGKQLGQVLREWEGNTPAPTTRHAVSIFDRL